MLVDILENKPADLKSFTTRFIIFVNTKKLLQVVVTHLFRYKLTGSIFIFIFRDDIGIFRRKKYVIIKNEQKS